MIYSILLFQKKKAIVLNIFKKITNILINDINFVYHVKIAFWKKYCISI